MIYQTFKSFYLVLTLLFALNTNCFAQAKIETLKNAGAWCWFSDPRAIYLHGDKAGVLTGWVKEDGSIESALIDLESNQVKTEILFPNLEKDDHDNPAFLELLSKDYMAFYAKHVNKFLYYHHSNAKTDSLFEKAVAFDPISEDEFVKYPKKGVTYANPVVLSSEGNRIYCFGRWTGYKPNVMWSDDNGVSFTQSQVFIAEEGFRSGNRPYVKYYSDGISKIHFIFTDGHPRNEATNSVYYGYYENGAFWRADGNKICDFTQMPFEPTGASVVYQATKETGRAWVHDIVADETGNPTILYTRHPSEEEHLYYYTHFDGKKWNDQLLCNSGKWFPQTRAGAVEKEPHYSGGMVIHPINQGVVYLSREVNGVFEIEKWSKKGTKGKWKTQALTQNSTFDNVRPYVPRNMKKGDKTVVLWMENEKYIHYTDYKTNIKYIVE
ncbi:MAG: BNR-4 repeat-containing protein [Cyclobacteriaceae bacterium]